MKVLFFTRKPADLDVFRNRLLPEGIESDVANYTDLEMLIDNNDTNIKLANTGKDLSDYDIILSVSTPEHKLIHIYNSIACYCRKKQIKFIDDSYTNTSGKLYEMWRCWENDLPVPKTAFGNKEFLSRALLHFGNIAVLKVTHGAKGRDNYLVHSEEELSSILANKDPYDYILQNFIPNDGDYRVVTIDYEPKLAIYRSANENDHRNNTSLGASAEIREITPELSELASKTAQANSIRFAGVDIIVDKNTNQQYILEINRCPQFVTGSFLDEKYAVLKDYLKSHQARS